MQHQLEHAEQRGRKFAFDLGLVTVSWVAVVALASGCQSRDVSMAQRAHYIVGYTDSRCDDPRGQYYNGLTRRAMVVRADGSEQREIGRSLITRECQAATITGWWRDGRAIVHVGYKSTEVGAWETQNRTFAKTTDGQESDCWLVDVETGQSVNLTAVERVSPVNRGLAPWPADPSRATFLASVDGKRRPFTMKLDGTDKRQVSSGDDNFIYGLSPSPDGRRSAYIINYRMYLADADGSNPRRVDENPRHEFQFIPVWSPDSQWLMFLAGEHYNCHPHIVRANGTGLRKIADRGGYRGVVQTLDHPDFHSDSSDLPVWSPDSRWVYYTAKVGKSVELMRVSLKGQVQRLTRSQAGVLNYQPKLSPDGMLVVFGSTRNGARSLYVADADGNKVQAITVPTKGRSQMHPHWQTR